MRAPERLGGRPRRSLGSRSSPDRQHVRQDRQRGPISLTGLVVGEGVLLSAGDPMATWRDRQPELRRDRDRSDRAARHRPRSTPALRFPRPPTVSGNHPKLRDGPSRSSGIAGRRSSPRQHCRSRDLQRVQSQEREFLSRARAPEPAEMFAAGRHGMSRSRMSGLSNDTVVGRDPGRTPIRVRLLNS